MAAMVLVAMASQGCMKSTTLEYQELSRALDGRSELHISTYPSWFPREVSGIPFLYKELRSPDSVYFQVFVRDAKKKSGRNSHVESITIHSFSYAFPGQEPVELISDFDGNFWMQGSPEYNPDGDAPVPVDPHWAVQLHIDLTLNGQRYVFDESVQGAAVESRLPLLLHALE